MHIAVQLEMIQSDLKDHVNRSGLETEVMALKSGFKYFRLRPSPIYPNVTHVLKKFIAYEHIKTIII